MKSYNDYVGEYNDYVGEKLAINKFNRANNDVKLGLLSFGGD